MFSDNKIKLSIVSFVFVVARIEMNNNENCFHQQTMTQNIWNWMWPDCCSMLIDWKWKYKQNIYHNKIRMFWVFVYLVCRKRTIDYLFAGYIFSLLKFSMVDNFFLSFFLWFNNVCYLFLFIHFFNVLTFLTFFVTILYEVKLKVCHNKKKSICVYTCGITVLERLFLVLQTTENHRWLSLLK